MSALNEQQGADLWPVAEVRVQGLFGERGFPVPLNQVVTVLTGENGSGKSTLLKALNWLERELWWDLACLPLEGLELQFVNGETLAVVKTDNALRIESGSEAWSFDLEVASQIEGSLLSEIHSAPQRYYGLRRGPSEDYAIRERLLRHRGIPAEAADGLVTPVWLSEKIGRFHTKLISARRLEHKLSPEETADGEERPLPVVEQYARELRDQMRDALSVYAAESRKQEKNLPGQIVEAMQDPQENADELVADVEQLRVSVRDLADSLANVGLFHDEEDPQQQFPEYPRNEVPILLAIREVYRVAEQRLQRLTVLRSDLELFADFLNDRLTNKRVILNQDNGIAIELASGEEIRPSQLSSGEEQLLALAFELLFGSRPQSLVLLDEPELSLHVAWLQGLLDAFVEMGQSRNLQFLIATHSPSVLSGYKELERSLDPNAIG